MPGAATHADAVRLELSSSQAAGLRWLGTLDGVLPLSVLPACGRGLAYLGWVVGSGLRLKAPGGTWGTPVAIPADGDYLVEDSDQDLAMRVRVVKERLPTAAAEARVILDGRWHDLIAADVSAAEAAAGHTDTWACQLRNVGITGALDVKVWVDAGSASAYEISSNGTTWVCPVSETDPSVITIASIAAGLTVNLWVRRTVPALSASDSRVDGAIRWAWLGA
jgi:hypothetical protein